MIKPILHLLFLSAIIFSPILLAEEITEQPIEQSEPEVQTPTFIELSAVPEEAAKANLALKEIADALTEEPKTVEIHDVLPSYTTSIGPLLDDPVYKDLEKQTLRTLQKLHQEWLVYNKQLIGWEQQFKERIQVYDLHRAKLEEYSALWSETHINATDKSAPEAIKTHITNVIIEIEKQRDQAKQYYDVLLTDTNLITTNITAINEKLTLLEETESRLAKDIFYQNQAPLSELFLQGTFAPLHYIRGIYTNLADIFQEFMIYHQTHKERQAMMLLGTLSIIGFVGYFNLLYRRKTLFVSKDSFHKKAYFFISRPFSTAIILIALFSIMVFYDAPLSVREIIIFIIFIPVFRIIQTVVHKKVEFYFSLYFGLYFFSLMEKHAVGYDLDDRFLNLAINVGLITLIIRFVRNKAADFVEMGLIKKIIYKALPLIILLLVISILANLYGAVLLSEKITHGVFVLFQASIIFYSMTIILSGYVIILLRRRISSATNILDIYAKKIEKTVTLVIKVIMVVWWFKVLIRTLGFETEFSGVIDTVLGLEWVIGTTTISLMSMASFIMILVGTWLLAQFVQIVLKVEVFARFQFSRGVPTAISATLNYIIIVSGILIAFSSLGVSTAQFAIVFGALGVGIGFGLRNIIANFISGIIMVFERPIQIGDTIEVDNTMGKVLSIGSRASSVKTFDGSEVIVPNEHFISSKVINWTLSDERRRKVLQIKVAFDSDIETVLEIMRDVALSHENVLKDPEPLPTFQGFGDYYLEFKLYYWLTENLIVAQSDVAIGVYKRLKAAKIATPMPIQELIMPKDRED
ncbi:MAG: mechanosensitive ion channel domain-containing protein [Sulfurimonadaceae bacterium]